MKSSTCWICEFQPATSREHRIKMSDVRKIFGEVSEAKPLFRQTEHPLPKPVKSLTSKALKFSPSLCDDCNNSRTQSHDLAWERLFSLVHDNAHFLASAQKFDLDFWLGDSWLQTAVRIHLFLAKNFGCRSIDRNAHLDLRPLSEAILSNKPVRDLHLAFWVSPGQKFLNDTAVFISQQLNAAYCGYRSGPLHVLMLYGKGTQQHFPQISWWDPENSATIPLEQFYLTPPFDRLLGHANA